MNFRIKQTYYLIVGFVAFAMLSNTCNGQNTESVHSRSYASESQVGIRSFERSDVLNTRFLRDSSQTFEHINGFEEINWDLVSSTSYEYDYLGKELSRIFKSVENDNWRNTKKWDNFYNIGNEISERNESTWSVDMGSWTPVHKYQYAYNHRGQELEILGFERDVNSWIPEYKRTYTYFLNDFVSNETVFYWNRSLSIWVVNSRILYTYNNSNSVSSEINQIWNDSLNVWENQFSQLFAYNEDNRVISSTRREWDNEQQNWVELSFISLMYNDKGQLSGSVRNELDDNAAQHSESASYSEDGNLGEIIHSVLNTESNIWESYEKEVHYWSAHVQGNLNDLGSDIDCRFANPYLLGLPWFCKNLKSDVMYTIEVYDLYGRLFYKNAFAWNATFRLNGNIPPGFYNVVIRGGLDYHTEKVLIRN